MESTSILKLNRKLTPPELQQVAFAYSLQMQEMQSYDHPLGSVAFPHNSYILLEALNERGQLEAWIDKWNGAVVAVLGYSVQDVWWTNGKKALVEETVKAISTNIRGFGRVALERLEELAKINDCAMIISGNIISQDQKLTENLYRKRGGFQFEYKQFIKVL